jgi:hypothetical protein
VGACRSRRPLPTGPQNRGRNRHRSRRSGPQRYRLANTKQYAATTVRRDHRRTVV